MKLIMGDRSQHVFGTIFLMNGENSDVLIGQLKFTKKQFYSRMTRLVKARLIRRHKGKYFLTSYGTVIYDAHRLLENAVKPFGYIAVANGGLTLTACWFCNVLRLCCVLVYLS